MNRSQRTETNDRRCGPSDRTLRRGAPEGAMGHKGKKMEPGRARHGRVATKPNEPSQRPSRFLRVSPLFGIFALALFMASSGANAQTITAPAAAPTVTATTMATLPGV